MTPYHHMAFGGYGKFWRALNRILPPTSFYICIECSDPTEQLQSHVSVSSLNGSVITYSCDPGYSFHGSTTSQCASGEWTPSPESVMCQEDIGMSK